MKTSLTKICTSHFIVSVRKGYSRFYGERELETEQNCNILTPLLWPSALCLSRSPGLLNRRTRRPTQLALSTTSYQQLLWTPTHQGLQGTLRPGVAFPTTSSLLLQLSDFLSWLSYIIVQRPLNRPLNPWNDMFNRHQAEITVMQFRGHSLPVYQSISVPWEFYLVPFC